MRRRGTSNVFFCLVLGCILLAAVWAVVPATEVRSDPKQSRIDRAQDSKGSSVAATDGVPLNRAAEAHISAIPKAPADATTAATAVAAAKVVIEVIGGLSSWVNDQADDCSAAALGAAWGEDCALNKRECTRTGWSSAWCKGTDTESENDCGRGTGSALAQEDPLGSWAGQTLKPWAVAWTKPLHGGTENDEHHARAWGKAKVDGDSQVEEEATSAAIPGVVRNPAQVFAHVYIDSIVFQCKASNSAVATDTLRLDIDGSTIFSFIACLNDDGEVDVQGDLSAGLFDVTFSPVTNTYEARLMDYDVSIPIGMVSGEPDTINVVLEGSAGSYDVDEIPTLSEWGIIVLVLLLIGCGLLVVLRSQRRYGMSGT